MTHEQALNDIEEYAHQASGFLEAMQDVCHGMGYPELIMAANCSLKYLRDAHRAILKRKNRMANTHPGPQRTG